MFNILDFIDSPAIREYNKNTQFTPAEQVVLIARSCGTTLDEKIAAMQELVDANTEETYQTDSLILRWYWTDEPSFSEMVAKTVEIWRNVLQKCKEAKNVAFLESLEEKEYFIESRCKDFNYYSSYDLAYQALLEEKKEHCEDMETDPDIEETFGRIRCVYLDSPYDYDEFLFDNDMRLINVRLSYQIKQEYGLKDEIEEVCYMHVPMPFKKGDLIKVSNPFWPTQYGVMSHDSITKEEDIHFINDCGDGWSMITSIDMYNEEFVHKFDYTDDTPYLDMYLCTEEELPEKEKMLLQIREARLGELDWMVLLYQNT